MQIGSGVAEAAGKTVVSTRAKRAGMRWTPQGLDAVLALFDSCACLCYSFFTSYRGQSQEEEKRAWELR
ncbi:hypothetical protein ccbrp13_32060 [Ktedonobacteria bacterium brp13]|nr:hypothetical protein ccbrp13_32060 [Ktedonobacteria bacterium brp13]